MTPDSVSRANIVGRAVWTVVYLLLFRPSPRPLHAWRAMLLRLFGAEVGHAVRIYQTARIWAPWNLEMQDHSCLGDHVDCYCVARVRLGRNAIVSQYSYLCTASHDYRYRSCPLISAPIDIGDDAWVTSDVFIGPGVHVGAGAVVTARSTVVRDIPEWVIASGNPAAVVKHRELLDG